MEDDPNCLGWVALELPVFEFECLLDLQADSSNNVCNKWRMKIQTEQNKPHRKQMSIDQEFKVSFTIINPVLQ